MAIKMPHNVKPVEVDAKAEAFIQGAGNSRLTPALVAVTEPEKTTVNMRFDVALLKRIDAAAKAQGISRTAWLHVAASKALS